MNVVLAYSLILMEDLQSWFVLMYKNKLINLNALFHMWYLHTYLLEARLLYIWQYFYSDDNCKSIWVSSDSMDMHAVADIHSFSCDYLMHNMLSSWCKWKVFLWGIIWFFFSRSYTCMPSPLYLSIWQWG